MNFKRKPYVRPSDENQTRLGTTWADVEGMIKQRAFPKWAGRVLVGLVIIVFVLVSLSVWNVHRISGLVNQNRGLVQQVRNGAVQSCLAGNRARATNKQIWDDFLTIALDNPEKDRTRTALLTEIGGLGLPADVTQGLDAIIVANWKTAPGNVVIVRQFEAYIAQHEFPVNCAKAYKN